MKKSVRDMNPAQERRRRRGLSVLSWTLATSGAVGAQTGAPPAVKPQTRPAVSGAPQDSQVLQFKIPAGPLDAALAEFRRVTGLKVVLTKPGIATVQSPGAAGSMTPDRAMDALLSGTGVSASFSPDAVRLDIRGVREVVHA